ARPEIFTPKYAALSARTACPTCTSADRSGSTASAAADSTFLESVSQFFRARSGKFASPGFAMSDPNILRLGVVAGFFWLSGIAWDQEAVIFAHYNIENYLEMNRKAGGEVVLSPKPEHEKETLIRILK